MQRRHFLFLSLASLSSPVFASKKPAPITLNQLILNQIRRFPKEGGYDSSKATTRQMAQATQWHQGRLLLKSQLAQPSYCSGATYLAFLHTLNELRLLNDPKVNQRLLIADIPDGLGVWGRWNANGPGTARLFHQTGLGVNFENPQLARPGDFLKLFWNDQIGAKERGHLVIFTGWGPNGEVHFWSSNQPSGYGFKSARPEQVRWSIFSRLTQPERIHRILTLPASDPFLADMMTRSFSRDEVRKACGMKRPARS